MPHPFGEPAMNLRNSQLNIGAGDTLKAVPNGLRQKRHSIGSSTMNFGLWQSQMICYPNPDFRSEINSQ
jgi:hypothetical protein